MKNIFRIIKKNLKLLVRAKSSALIIILAPLLIILLVGIAFDNANTYGLNIGVYSTNYNQNVESFLNKLSQKEFKIVKYQDQEKCINDIKLAAIHTCVIFPPSLDFNANQQQQITFYVDYSKINLVWMIMDTLSAGITERSREISKDLTNILVSKLEKTKSNLDEKKPVLINAKTANNNVLANAQEVDENLASITFDLGNFSFNQTQNLVSSLQNNLSLNIEEARFLLKSARSTVSGSDASEGDKEEALEDINDALSELETAKNRINDSESNQTLAHVYTLIQQIQDELNQTQNQITAAATASQQKINEAQNSLSQSLSSLGEIETMMENLLTEIQGIQVTDPSAIASPVTTDIKPVAAEKTYLNYLFPGLMILVVMFISILLGTTLVMMEKHSPALFRNFITPTRNITFIISTYLTNIFLILIQLVIILGIAMYFFSAQILPSLPMVILILLMAATLFSFVGMGVGYVFMSEETGTLAAISFGSLCLFLSSLIIPLESMPAMVRQIAYYNPFVIAERLLRSIILFQPKIKFLATDLFILLGYAFVLFLFIWGSQYLASKNILTHYKYKRHKKARHKKEKKGEKKDKTQKSKPGAEIKETKSETPPSPKPAFQPTANKRKMPRVVTPSQTEKSPSNPAKKISNQEDLKTELQRINKELSQLR